jgi:MOSC domain-containing protein YiiM
MIEVDLPTGEGVPELVRSFAACLASMTETPVAEVPLPQADLPGAFAHWRSWFAGRGQGLVAIAKPASFNWPGYWVAVLGEPRRPGSTTEDTVAVLMFGTPSGVVLSPQDPKLVGRAAADLPIVDGYVLSGLDPASTNATNAPQPELSDTVEVIALAEQATADMHVVEHVKAFANRGLEGDRYAAKAGTFTPANDNIRGYDLTLIEAEVLDSLSLPGGNRMAYADARRNIVTRGIDLNALVGRRFRIGNVECLGQRLCEPCSHLERLTTKGALRALIHRGGLRADILNEGEIISGAAIVTLD